MLNLNCCSLISEVAVAALVESFPESLASALLELRATRVPRNVQRSCEILPTMQLWLKAFKEDMFKSQRLQGLDAAQPGHLSSSTGAAPARPATPQHRVSVDTLAACTAAAESNLDSAAGGECNLDSDPADSVACPWEQQKLLRPPTSQAKTQPDFFARTASMYKRGSQFFARPEQRNEAHNSPRRPISSPSAPPKNATAVSALPFLGKRSSLQYHLIERANSTSSGGRTPRTPQVPTSPRKRNTVDERKTNRHSMATMCLNRHSFDDGSFFSEGQTPRSPQRQVSGPPCLRTSVPRTRMNTW